MNVWLHTIYTPSFLVILQCQQTKASQKHLGVTVRLNVSLFKQFKYANFRTNLNNLRKDFIDRRKRSAFDEAALKNDRQLVQRGTQTHRGYPFWPETEASKLLEIDLKEGKHRQMKPAALYTTRPEYQVFPLDVFRDHVHQELRSQRERPYWLQEVRTYWKIKETMKKLEMFCSSGKHSVIVCFFS
jgi:hypothetical protein